jgi:hypothetical protein
VLNHLARALSVVADVKDYVTHVGRSRRVRGEQHFGCIGIAADCAERLIELVRDRSG